MAAVALSKEEAKHKLSDRTVELEFSAKWTLSATKGEMTVKLSKREVEQ
jgi:hypothetical protein